MFGRGSGIPDVSSRPCYARLKHFRLLVFELLKGVQEPLNWGGSEM